MSGGSCAATRSISPLASPGARATTRSLRPRPPTSSASMWPRQKRLSSYALMKSHRSRPWNERRAIRNCPNGRSLTGQSHDYKRHGTTTLFAALGSRHREDPCDAFETTSPGRVSRLHGSRDRSISEHPASAGPKHRWRPRNRRASNDVPSLPGRTHRHRQYARTPTTASPAGTSYRGRNRPTQVVSSCKEKLERLSVRLPTIPGEGRPPICGEGEPFDVA